MFFIFFQVLWDDIKPIPLQYKYFTWRIFMQMVSSINCISGCCTILAFRPFLLMCNRFRLLIIRFSKNRWGLERFFSPLESGTNREFLAQGVQKWWLKEGNAKNGCCDFFAFRTLFAHVQQISTSNQSIFKKYMRSGKIFFSS